MKKWLFCIYCILIAVLSGSYASAFEPEYFECLVPAKAGGGMDISCQLIANSLWSANLIDTPVTMRYKPGGIGAVAYNHVVGIRNSDPHLIVAASSGSALNIATQKFGRYDVNDVRWLGALGADYGVIAVRRDAPWDNLNQLVDVLRHAPRAITIGGGGSIGSQDWMKTALIAQEAFIDPKMIRYVAFEGGGEAAAALLNGYIDVFPGDAAELNQLFQEGKVKILAVLADKRLPDIFSSVPTAREQGYLVDWTIWRGFYMGPNVSEESYQWWLNTLKRLIKTKEFKQQQKALGLYPFELIGPQFAEYVRESVAKQKELATGIGLIQ